MTLRVINIGYLHKCLSFELKIGNKIFNFVGLFRSPSQSETILRALEVLAQKYLCQITAIGDFNAKSTNWYNKGKTSTIKNVTS